MDSLDDLSEDMLDAREKAARDFGFNRRQEKAIDYIRKNIPISGVADVLTEDLWLREVLKDIDSDNYSVRSKALEMLGKYIGVLGAKGRNPGPKKTVEFED